jgi:hypothetical protein
MTLGRPRSETYKLPSRARARMQRLMNIVRLPRGVAAISFTEDGIWRVHDMSRKSEKAAFEGVSSDSVVGIYQRSGSATLEALYEMVLQDLKEAGAI